MRLLIVLSACGRVSFDPIGGSDISGDSAINDADTARVCQPLNDDFEAPIAPCGTWGAVSPTSGMWMRSGGVLEAIVAAGEMVGCLGAALDVSPGLWIEIDTVQSGSDVTAFGLGVGPDTVEFVLVDNGTPTWQGMSSSTGVAITPPFTQVYSRDVMRFWRFSRGTPSTLYNHIDVAYSTNGDPASYIHVLTFGISGLETTTVTPYFRVEGSSGSVSHPSTRFDNYNVPCTP